MSTVHEVCSCGAVFDYTATGSSADFDCKVAAASFRKGHLHQSLPPEPAECCASGRCEVCCPGYVWGRDG